MGKVLIVKPEWSEVPDILYQTALEEIGKTSLLSEEVVRNYVHGLYKTIADLENKKYE